ncbi:MAG: Uma2 family endonuclease [Pyrinomonadaceae bacterium]
MSTKIQATIEDLYNVPENGKAEIVNGELVLMSPSGGKHGRTCGEIYSSLRQYERQSGKGYAFPDNVGFIVDLPNRRSFSPDAAFYIGGDINENFPEGAPIFAVEVRSKGDYGVKAEKKIAAKIADYFAAGTLVVWDVDTLRDQEVRVYRADDPHNPTVYGRGEIAEAEPALPGYQMSVDDLFV